MLSFGGENQHAAWTGGPDVAVDVELKSVARAWAFLTLQWSGEEDVAQAGTIEVADRDARILARPRSRGRGTSDPG